MRLARRRSLAALFASIAIVAASFGVAQALRYSRAPTRITVKATPIPAFDTRDETKTRFGQLEYRGGLILTSNDQAFGGISALIMEPGGARFLSLTDHGSWLRGRIVYREGRPDGIADAEMAPMLGQDGKPLAARHWFDTESLTQGVDGMLYVGIERVEKIVRFDFRRDGFAAKGEPVPVPEDFKTFAFNKSLECLAAPPKGAPLSGSLIAITERSLDASGNHRSFVLKGAQVNRFTLKRSDDFDVSDCAVFPPADLLVLERRYSLLRGVAIRIRRIHLDEIKEGAVVDGPQLFFADLGYQIDNMEGIGLHKNAQGETILTLVSDDNFSPIQRTLLLQFALVGE